MSPDLATEFLAAAVRLAVPVLLAALGEIVTQRSGVINVGLEGMMLCGCLASVLATLATGSAALGLVAALAAGALMALLFALVVVRARGDAVVSGTAINLLALGLTGFVYESAFGRTGSVLAVQPIGPFAVPLLGRLPVVGPALFQQAPTTYLAFALAVAVALLLSRTGLGLRIRAAGEAPHAVAAAGASVAALRTGAVIAGGACAGLGGGTLALAHAGTFVTGMTAGRGFLALALVLCARRNAWLALAVGLLFGLAAALPFELQALGSTLPYQLARMAPYLLALGVLALTSRRLGSH